MRSRFAIAVFGLVSAFGVSANDFPTQARVEFAMGCMDRHGGQSYNTMYGCVCTIDKIASQMKYEDYAFVETMSFMIKTPGERGGAFRDKPGARKQVREFAKIRDEAERTCFVKNVTQDSKPK
ncbi:MAG: hypothetical protein OES09_06500 [Gammaproteobacteria bacterium]|nr:hypothetical protein [Gammaproteobacteria bacterium]